MEKRYNLIHDFLIKRLEKQYGEVLTCKILDGYKCCRKSSLRVNTSKIEKSRVLEIFENENIGYESVSWYLDAFVVSDIDKIRCLDIYKDGCIYVQSLSSMIPPIVLNPACERILDMAASPGGKTTEIYNLSKKEAIITAVEKNPIRADRLKYNISKQGTQATVLVSDASKLDEFFRFDKILLDAPCSGTGTLSINNESLNYFNEKLIENSIDTQKKLLSKALQILKVGSIMVYSTCSILYEENEKQLEDYIRNGVIEVVPIDFNLFKDVPMLPVSISGTMCVCPTDLYEGFFVACIRRLK